MPKRLLKALCQGASLVAAFLPALACGFGRWEAPFTIFAHGCALLPGLIGDCLRIAYYKLTLAECSLASRVSFGSFLAHPHARLGPGVYIGSYCIVGMAVIGERTRSAPESRSSAADASMSATSGGRSPGAETSVFSAVTIGADCWIGAAAVVMADVGAGAHRAERDTAGLPLLWRGSGLTLIQGRSSARTIAGGQPRLGIPAPEIS